MILMPDGHFRGMPGAEEELACVVLTEDGRQETLSLPNSPASTAGRTTRQGPPGGQTSGDLGGDHRSTKRLRIGKVKPGRTSSPLISWASVRRTALPSPRTTQTDRVAG